MGGFEVVWVKGDCRCIEVVVGERSSLFCDIFWKEKVVFVDGMDVSDEV